MTKSKLKNYSSDRAIRLKNKICLYCGKELKLEETTKEHVIGRKFVPKGTLNKKWNLIALACNICNNIKSKLEDDISAITMQPDIFGRFAAKDELLEIEYIRKSSKSKSKRTGIVLAKNKEEVLIDIPFSSQLAFSFNMVMPAQIDYERVFRLSRFHIGAFFFLITYNVATNMGSPLPGDFNLINYVAKSNWGNPKNISFMNFVQNWEPRILGTTAEGYFKINIRRHPNLNIWSWAIEWNQNYRLIGFFGDLNTIEFKKSLPPLLANTVSKHKGNWQISLEKEIDEKEDILFHKFQDSTTKNTGKIN